MVPAMEPLPQTFAATRDALHRLAVYVISPVQRLVNGEIIMRAAPGGFETFPFAGGRVVGVEGALLRDGDRRTPITSLRAAAGFVGIEPDVAQEGQFDVPPAGDLDAPLDVDPAAARALGEWYALVTAALEALRAGAGPGDDASIVRLWPEHFDAAIDMGGPDHRGTYGGSPGDGAHPEPYLYASPWAGRIDPFFADPHFRGASLAHAELLAEADPAAAAAAFLRRARTLIDPS
jgi:hypothetical protein